MTKIAYRIFDTHVIAIFVLTFIHDIQYFIDSGHAVLLPRINILNDRFSDILIL